MTELAALNVRLQGDASDLRAALSSASDALASLQKKIEQTDRSQDRLAKSARDSADAFRAFDRSKRSIDALRASYDPLFAASKQYEAALETINTALAQGVIKQNEYDRMLDNLGSSMLTAGGQARAFGRSMNASAAHSTNLMFQMQDIGMMLAAGQSPLMLAMQQGTQVTGVFHQMRASGVSVAGGLASAFTSLVSPMALLTVGTIAGGAALAQWGMKAMGAGRQAVTFDDIMGNLRETMSSADRITGILEASVYDLRQEYGYAAEAVRGLAVQQAQLTAAQATRRMSEELSVANEALRQYVQTSSSAFRSGTTLGAAMMNVARDFNVTEVQARSLSRAMLELRDAQSYDEQREALQRVLDLMDEYGADLSAIPPELSRAINEMITLVSETDRATEAMRQLGAEARGVSVGVMLSADDPDLLPPEPVSAPARTGGGGGGGNQLQSELEALQQSLMSQEQLQIESFQRQQEVLQQALEQRLITQQEYAAMMEAAQSQHQDRMSQIDVWRYGSGLQQAETFFGQMAGAMQSGNERMMQVAKAFGAAEALINAFRAYNQVIADPSLPWFAKIPAALGVLSAGMNAVNAIKGIGSGGGGSSAGVASGAASGGASASAGVSRNVAIQLTGGNMFSRDQVINLINGINEAVEDGAIVRVV